MVRIAAALLVLLLAACSGPPGTPDGPTPAASAAPETAQVMACATEAYPCSAGEVAPEVLDRSAALAAEAAELADDDDLDAAVTWLKAQDGIVDVGLGGHAIRFRLEGGLPTWIMERRNGAAEAPAVTSRATTPMRLPIGEPTAPPPAAPLPGLGRVIGSDPIVKTGLVLEPFAWSSEPDAGAEVAEILRRTRGYDRSTVGHLANRAVSDSTVTYRTFRELSGNNVIYLSSEGGQTCRADGTRCHSVIASNEVPDGTKLPTDVPGLQMMTFIGGGQAFAMSMDFFVAAYDGVGVKDAVLFLNVPNLPQDGLLDAITASNSSVFFWAGDRPTVPANQVVLNLLDRLATTGRAIGPVYHEMYDELRVGDARFDSIHPENLDGTDQRLREVVWLRDPSTEESLDAAGVLQVDGKLGDGKPDTVRFLVDVDGLPEAEALEAMLRIEVDTTQAKPLLVASGRQISSQMWQLSGSYELPWDLAPGKNVKLSAIVDLPEGGVSRQDLVLPVRDNAAPDLGTVWEGTATAVSSTLWEGVTITRTATVQFTRDPSSEGGKSIRYYLSGGSMTFEFRGMSGECSQFPPPVEVPLVASEYSSLMFDVSDPEHGVTYSGTAYVDGGPSVDVHVTCETHSFDYSTRAEGTFFLVPEELGLKVTDTTIESGYVDDQALSTEWSWTLTRVK